MKRPDIAITNTEKINKMPTQKKVLTSAALAISKNSIVFKGPFHFNHTRQINPKNSGVYIWGFLYNDEVGQLRVPINHKSGMNSTSEFHDTGINLKSNQKFIPYYVGIDKKLNEFTRIKKHHQLQGDVMKYTRFEWDYMNTFFLGNDFPINFSRTNSKLRGIDVVNFVKANPNCLQYFNNPNVLQNIYRNIIPTGAKNHWPINNQYYNGQFITDTLKQLIVCYDNFYFCYADVPASVRLEDVETSTFWSLKGFTISQIERKLPNLNISGNSNCNSIFRPIGTLNPIPALANSSYFLGY